jgi:hypothetical protein
MKVTNYGIIGNPYTNISSDPSGQWPGASGIEYLNYIALAVGAVNPPATDPTAVRRVSYVGEWGPPTPNPEDRMYRAYDGIINGARLINDDSDFNPFTGEPNIDEDFLDGHDNDGDGKIDEDFGALGQLEYTCLMRDDTPAAYASSTTEAHVALVVEAQESGWAYSVPGFTDFDVVQWDIYNRSGHTLDSMFFGIRIDIDAGPASSSTYYSDDFDVPKFPQGDFVLPVDPADPRFQTFTDIPVGPTLSASRCTSASTVSRRWTTTETRAEPRARHHCCSLVTRSIRSAFEPPRAWGSGRSDRSSTARPI